MNSFRNYCLIMALLFIWPRQQSFGQWNMIYNFQAQMRGITFVNNDTGYICGAYEGPMLMRTVNGGYTWEDITGNFTDQIMSVKFISPSTGFLYTHANINPGIYSTSDSGSTWQFKYFEPPYIQSFCFPTAQVGYAIAGVMEYVDVIKTTDGGITWSKVAGLTTVLPGTGVTETVFLDENLGYFSTDEGSVYKTINGGYNWTRVYHSHYYSMTGIAFVTPLKGFISATKKDWTSTNYGLLLRTYDGGVHWDSTFFDPGLGAIHFTNPDTGFLGCDKIYKTVDGGMTWYKDTCNYWGGVTRFCFPTSGIGYAIGGNLLYKRDPEIGVSVPKTGVDGSVSLWPVPASDRIVVSINFKAPSRYSIEIIDMIGHLIASQSGVQSISGNTTIDLRVGSLPCGAYLCRIRMAERCITRKMVIAR